MKRGKRSQSTARKQSGASAADSFDVLTAAAEDYSHEEIAESLGIAARTVAKHLENAYDKLGVRRPMPALERAAALGYVDVDVPWQGVHAARGLLRGADVFGFFCASV